MSIDLVGSTALKQEAQGSQLPIQPPNEDDGLKELGASWLFDISGFYSDVETKFAKNWKFYADRTEKEWHFTCESTPKLWKSNGDELIYVKDLSSAKECIVCILTWMKTAKEISNRFRETGRELDVKLTAWTAGFPLVNSEIIFRSSPEIEKFNDEADDPTYAHYKLLNEWHSSLDKRHEYIVDFIGPSIDTGFRISSKATSRKFMVSLEIALFISVTSLPRAWEKIMLRFDRGEKLKGVIEGNEYPLFWIDMYSDGSPMRSNLINLEDEIRGDGQNFRKIKDYCETFIEESSRYILHPFIVGDSEPIFSSPPPHYEDRINQIFKKWEKLKGDSRTRDKALKEGELPEGDAENYAEDSDVEIPDLNFPIIEDDEN